MPEFSFDFLLILLAAFGAGVIDAMVGGGGLIQLPALFAVYPQAAPPTLLGTSKLAGILGTASAVWRYSRRVHIPWRALLPLGGYVLIASFAGALLATRVDPAVFRPLVPIMLVAVLVYTLWRKDLGSEHAPRGFRGAHHAIGAFALAAVGFYDGFFGPGTGSFLMLVFVRCYGFDFLHASAAARVLNVAANGAALFYFASRGYVLWQIGAAMAVCNISGSFVGTRLALGGGSRFVRYVFLAVVSLLIARTAWIAISAP
jgi:uncharacterized membrane protein YfcA